ncbi:cilia- and flagella- associated protein 210-like isoform X1 [Trachinotus anak]|uniref:cilia- and flagella- associated protein 210-like isoform X1 n=1 Tax=Trachinotus anak TaxID=443729 RepID=UPI0039F181BB
MASANITNLFKAEWVRIQSAQRSQPNEAKLNNRQAVGDRYANNQWFNQNSCLRFNSAVLRKETEKENRVLTELKKRKQQLAEDENVKYEEMMQSRLKEDLRRDQERIYQRKLQGQAVAQYQVRQMKEREQLKEKERLQDKKDAELLRKLDEKHAQELRCEMEKKAQAKKINLKNQLEDIYKANLKREAQVHKLKIEEQKLEFQRQEMLLQRKPEQAERFRRLEVQREIVRDKLAATKKEQTATTALLEEQRFAKDVSKRKAELAKQQKEKEEKRAAVLQCISVHRQKMIIEKEQKAKAEKQSNLDWLQVQKQADMLSTTNKKLKAQRTRVDRIKMDNVNFSLAAEKRAHAQQLKKDEHDSAVRNAEQTAQQRKHLQQYIQYELHEAAENLWCQERQNLSISYKETSKDDLRPTCLPPISKAAKATLAAPDSTGRGFGLGFSVEGSSHCSADTGEPLPRLSKPKPRLNNLELRHGETRIIDLRQTRLSPVPTVCKLQQASAAPSLRFPPIQSAVMQDFKNKLSGPA